MKVVVFAGVSFLDMYTSTTLTMLQDTRRLCLQLPELLAHPHMQRLNRSEPPWTAFCCADTYILMFLGF